MPREVTGSGPLPEEGTGTSIRPLDPHPLAGWASPWPSESKASSLPPPPVEGLDFLHYLVSCRGFLVYLDQIKKVCSPSFLTVFIIAVVEYCRMLLWHLWT